MNAPAIYPHRIDPALLQEARELAAKEGGSVLAALENLAGAARHDAGVRSAAVQPGAGTRVRGLPRCRRQSAAGVRRSAEPALIDWAERRISAAFTPALVLRDDLLAWLHRLEGESEGDGRRARRRDSGRVERTGRGNLAARPSAPTPRR
jgi:hypothetical protein